MKVSSASANSNANAESVENGPLINILLHNNKEMVIKKSSFYWLLDNKTKGVSNDRLCCFIYSEGPNKLKIKTPIIKVQKTSVKLRENINKKPRILLILLCTYQTTIIL